MLTIQTAAPGRDIVVTGLLLRRTNTETPSPATVIISGSQTPDGITNVNDAIRLVPSDSAGKI